MTGRPYRASVGLFASVTTHMNNEHVLRFERLLRSAAALPLAHKLATTGRHVLLVQVLQTRQTTKLPSKTYGARAFRCAGPAIGITSRNISETHTIS